MRASTLFARTLREAPAEAEVSRLGSLAAVTDRGAPLEHRVFCLGFTLRERPSTGPHSLTVRAYDSDGNVGTVNLVFLHAQTKFENRAEDTGELPEE